MFARTRLNVTLIRTLPVLCLLWRNGPNWAQSASLLSFLVHTQLDTRTHQAGLSERVISSSQKPLTYTTHSKQKRRTSMLTAEFEAALPAIKGLHTYALDRMATGSGN